MFIAKVLVTASAFFSLASAVTYNVAVGTKGLTFDPSFVSNATAGDTILFQFSTTSSHTATQSSFDTPCVALPGGINSEIRTSASNPTFSVPINGTDPLWIFCSFASHCQSGMVFAVNPTTSQTYDAFKANVAGGKPSGSSTSTSRVSSTPSGTSSSGGGGYGSTGSGAKMSVQKLTAGLAGVAFLAKLLL